MNDTIKPVKCERGDKLRIGFINTLPQPLIVRLIGGHEWLVYDIDVETGLMRIDVCGKLQVTHINEASLFRDMDGIEHEAETFYSDYEPDTEMARK